MNFDNSLRGRFFPSNPSHEKTEYQKINDLITRANDYRGTDKEEYGIRILDFCQTQLINAINPQVNKISSQECSTLVSKLYADKNFKPTNAQALASALTQGQGSSFNNALSILNNKTGLSK